MISLAPLRSGNFQLALSGASVEKSRFTARFLSLLAINLPKAVYAPGPQPPHGTAKPQPVAVELLRRRIMQGNPSPDVAESVLDTVGKWKFEPARLLGVPFAMTIRLKVEFRSK
jgi:hypothetical protein